MSGLHLSSWASSHLPASLPQKAEEVLARADIQINGNRPWDMKIHHDHTLSRIALQRSLGLGESYMDGWWDCDALDEFFYRFLSAGGNILSKSGWQRWLQRIEYVLHNRQSLRRSRQVAEQHYNLDNTLFEYMLDPTMSYSCGYWRDVHTLAEAQTAKLDLICRKLELEPGMSLLDIGCGWGGLLQYAAQHYGAHGTGITVSQEQAELGQARCAGLPVKIELHDYREQQGKFDRIVSVGMFEHVGRRNYHAFMKTCARLMKKDSLMLLHTIGSNTSEHVHDPWIDKYIFPNGELPSIRQIGDASERHFLTEDLQNFGPDYALTLRAWDANFCRHWSQLQDKYDERFYRMWRNYLNACAGTFQARALQLWQWVFSLPGGRKRSYIAAR